jgi:hypothetical protein
MKRVTALVVLGLVMAGCNSGGGPPQPGAPVDPHPVGEAVEVGGWSPVDTLLTGYAARVESPGDQQAIGWEVKVISPSGPCPGDPMAPEKEVVCIGVEVTNHSAQAGGLDFPDGLPLVVDATGAAGGVTRLRVADAGDWTDFGQEVSIAADCTFSAPDEEGRQQADCSALVSCERRSGVGGDEYTGWVTVGAGRTARYDLEYIVGEVGSGLALWWPDGTWFAIP